MDRLESVDQTLIKHAAILGMSFPREMLEAIVPSNLHGKKDYCWSLSTDGKGLVGMFFSRCSFQ